MAESIDTTLAQRGSRYGIFAVHAEHTQALKKLLRQLMGESKWNSLHQDQQEALEMIAHKLGRITNGDPNYDDSWRDIAGYAQLVANRLAGQAESKTMQACTEAAEATGKLAAEALNAIVPKKFKEGDRVRIIDDAGKAEALCDASNAGWHRLMEGQCGQLATVVEHNERNNVKLAVLGHFAFWWAAGCIEPAPIEEEEPMIVHTIVLDGSDPDVASIQRMLADFLKGVEK